MGVLGRKWISLLLTLCMVLSLLPVTARAADGNCTGEHSGWTALTINYLADNSYTLSTGNYYLQSDLDAGTQQIKITGTVNLCLNGHTFTGEATDGVFRVGTDGTLNVYDCGSGGMIQSTGGHNPIFLHSGGACNLYSGTIQSNVTAVVIDDNELYRDGYEGGTANYTGGTFAMYGGTVRSTSSANQGINVNPNLTGAAVIIQGGTVYSGRYGINAASGTVTLSGDLDISGGTAGIYLRNGATIIPNNPLGGSVSVAMASPGVFTSNGGTSYRQYFYSSSNLYEVQIEGSELKLATPSAHSHSVGDGGSHVTFTSTSALGGTLSAGSYYLSRSITATDDITINGTVKLCLNGYTLDLNGHHIVVENGGSLTLCDCGTTGQITGGAAEQGGAILVEGGSLTLHSGTITGNTASGGGDGSGGSNRAGGGAVCVNGGSFTMTGGSIEYNTAAVTKKNDGGGGVLLNSGSFTMSGGSITGNQATETGGGIYVLPGTTFELSGDPDISGNTAANTASNIHLNGPMITLTGALTSTAPYGVSMASPGTFTCGWNTYMSSARPDSCFTSDSIQYLVLLNGSEAALHAHSYTYSGSGAVITESCTCGHTATATISIRDGADLTYTGSAITPAQVTYSTGWLGGNLTPAYENNTNAGTATATITKDSKTAGVTFSITAKEYSGTEFVIEDIADQIYTGSAVTPSVIIKFGGKTLVNGMDYILSYGDNITVGTSSVTITFQGNYSGTAEKTFKIVYAPLPGGTSNSTVFQEYDTTSHWSNSASVTFETQVGWAVSKTPDSGYSGQVGFDVASKTDGTHSETVYVKDTTTGHIYETQISYKLDKTAPQVSGLTAEGDGSWIANDVTVSFTASDAPSGIASVTVAGPNGSAPTATAGSNGQYTFTAAENGTYTVTVTDQAGNSTQKEINLTNIDKTAPVLTVAGGMESGGELTLTVNGTNTGGSGVTVTVEKDDGTAQEITGSEYQITEAGTYAFTATTGAGKTTTVTKTIHSITFDSNGGSEVDKQLVADGGKITTPAVPQKTGYAFDCWLDGHSEWNFTSDTVSCNLTLTARWTLNAPTVSLSASETEVTYGTDITLTATASHEASVTYTYEWYKDGAKLSNAASTLTLTGVDESGSYTVKVTAKDSGGLTAQETSGAVTVSIGKANPVTHWPTASAIIYGQSLGASQLTGGSGVPGSFAWKDSSIAPKVSDSGTTNYTVVFTPTDTDNYNTVEGTVTVQVHKATLTPAVDSVNDKTYDGSPDTTGTITLTGAVLGDQPTATGVFTFDNANADTDKQVTVTVTLVDGWDSNYVLSQSELTTTADITPKTVGLTWDGYENLIYNGQPAAVTAAATGLVEGDECTVIVHNGNQVNANTYTARATDLSNSNYQLPTDGTIKGYTISPRPVELSWDKDSFTYDGTAKTVTATIDNLVSSDNCELTYKGNEKTETGGYTAKVIALGNNNYTLTGGKNLTHNWTIGKKTITGTWTGIKQVYGDDSPAAILPDGLEVGDSAEDIHYHYTGTTADGTDYDSDTPPEEVGTYTVTATMDNYAISNGTATLVIEKKPVVITVTNNAAAAGDTSVEPTINVPSGWVKDEDYTVTYKDKDGSPADLTQPGTYEVWVEFENPNYRHPDGSTGKQVGSFTVTTSAPTLYAVAFDGNKATGGTMADLELAGGSALTLPECGYTKAGHQFTGWLYGGKTYKSGDGFTMPYGTVTFTAQWQAVFTVSGTITEQTDSGEEKAKYAVVSLWLGANKIRETHTDANGDYTFSDLLPGVYNLVVSKDRRTVTRKAIIETSDAVDCDAVLPKNVTNSIVEVAPGSPDIVVGNLENAFTADDMCTAEDGGKVEITFTAQEKQEVQVRGDLEKIKTLSGGSSLSLIMDYTMTKSVTDSSGTTTTNIPQSSVLLEVWLPLPADLQGRYTYQLYRVHDGKAETLTTAENELGEYFEVSQDKTMLILHVKCFSTYALGYRNAPSTPTYPPVKNESENGSYMVSPSNPAAGQTVTITPQPDESYVVGSVTVTDKNGKDVTVTPNTDGTYTFTQPSGSVTVTVTFRKDTNGADCPRDESCPMAAFSDLNPNAWYHNGVHYCLDGGLMWGYGNGIFGPNNQLSRAMLVQILYNLENRPTVSGKSVFNDVGDSAWYADAVNWAGALGIVKGYGNGNYGPDDHITREQLAAILYRYARYKGYDVSVGADVNILSYTDAQEISEYAVPAVRWVCGTGIMVGHAGALDPTGTATRAQAATMLMRFGIV